MFFERARCQGLFNVKKELEEKVKKLKEQEKAEKYEENLRDTAVCAACLTEQKIQRKIDDKTFNQIFFESFVRTLVCEYCKHANLARDGDDTLCSDCGALQSPDAVTATRYQQ